MVISLAQLIVYVLIGILAAWIAMAAMGVRYPFGFIGAFVAAIVGEWLMISVLRIILAPEVSYAGIPIITALVGALILAFLVAVVLGGGWRGRYRRI
ncbi:MAG: GlsB/YeaQ/YmgE family stress response membrane protein [Chloroflexi bacterium]|nr:GlsB/YeaQ/YmgE family stress response membrane protein [Chloroflexota bacterium]